MNSTLTCKILLKYVDLNLHMDNIKAKGSSLGIMMNIDPVNVGICQEF